MSEEETEVQRGWALVWTTQQLSEVLREQVCSKASLLFSCLVVKGGSQSPGTGSERADSGNIMGTTKRLAPSRLYQVVA